MEDAAERSELLEIFSGRDLPYPRDESLVSVFARGVQKWPDSIALQLQHQTLSYQALDRLSDSIAQRLIQRGVGHGSIVGLHTGRSLESIAAILGILKAGACYLPLDPAYPEARLKLMVEDAQPALVLADGPSTSSWMSATLPVLSLKDASRWVEGPEEASPRPASAGAPVHTWRGGRCRLCLLYFRDDGASQRSPGHSSKCCSTGLRHRFCFVFAR